MASQSCSYGPITSPASILVQANVDQRRRAPIQANLVRSYSFPLLMSAHEGLRITMKWADSQEGVQSVSDDDFYRAIQYIGQKKFDLIILLGVLSPSLIGKSLPLVYRVFDHNLLPHGVLLSMHLDSDYHARFPFLLINTEFYEIDGNVERLEAYIK